MAGESKTYERRINIWINGKEVTNDISSIKKEMYQLTNELARTTRGTKEYNEKAAELRQLKGILKEHQDNISATGTAWTKVKDLFNSAWGIIGAGVAGIMGAYQTIKGVVTSTGELSDKMDVTLSGWKSGIDAVRRSIANLDFKDFTKNIKAAIDEGRRYAENLDEIDDKTRALQIAEAKAKNDLLEQRRIQSDVTKSLTERNDAGKEAIRIEEELANIRISIAQQAFDNELENLTKIANPGGKINDQMREQIKLYVQRDEQFMKGYQLGKDYNDMLKEYEQIYQKSGFATKEEWKRRDQLFTSLSNVNEEQLRWSNIVKTVSIPTDEEYNRLTEKWVSLENAKGSAMENTMKIFSKNAGIEKQITDTQEKELQDAQERLSTIIDQASYRPEAFYNNDDLDKWVEDQIAANDLREKDYKETQDAIYAMVAETALKAQKAIDQQNKEEEETLKKKLDAYLDFASAMGNILGQTMFDTKKTAKETIKDLIKLALDALQDIVWIAIGETTIMNLAKSGWKGLLEAAAITAAIETAFEGAKSAVTSMYWNGGYTPWGGKYEPAGVVHKGEYVASQEMVASPVTGPIIQALENYRTGQLKGFAGGGMTDGSGSVPGASVITSGSNLESAINRLNTVLDRLERNGVNNYWPWGDIDNLRKGIDKLDDLEDSVSLS
jgi:hypothetical protein